MAMETTLPSHIIRRALQRGCQCTWALRRAGDAPAARRELRRKVPSRGGPPPTNGRGRRSTGVTERSCVTVLVGMWGMNATPAPPMVMLI